MHIAQKKGSCPDSVAARQVWFSAEGRIGAQTGRLASTIRHHASAYWPTSAPATIVQSTPSPDYITSLRNGWATAVKEMSPALTRGALQGTVVWCRSFCAICILRRLSQRAYCQSKTGTLRRQMEVIDTVCLPITNNTVGNTESVWRVL